MKCNFSKFSIKTTVEHPLTLFLIITLALITPTCSFAKVLLPFPLMLLMYINFLTIRINPGFIKHKTLILYFIFALIIFPAVLTLIPIPVETAIKHGIIIAAITPTAIASPVVCDLIGGNKSRIVTQMVFINLISPLTYTFAFLFLFKQDQIKIPYTMIALRISLLILFPLLLSRFTLLVKKDFSVPNESLTKRILFYCVVFIAVSSAANKLKEMSFSSISITALTIFLLALIQFITGSFFSTNKVERITDALLLGHKNIGLSVWISLTNFSPETSIPLVLYVISHHIINGILIVINNRNK